MPMLLDPKQEWYCPNCGLTDTTRPVPNRFHTCAKLRGLTAPLLPAGMKAKVVAVEREDYVGKETVQLDPERQRPVMAINTIRDDGSNDLIVLAPTATATGRA